MTNPNTRPKRYLFWPVLLTGLIGTHIISVVTMVVVATHDRSFAVEPDFYQKGLHYEQALDQRRENARLGWSLRLEVGPPESGTYRRSVTCRLADRDGQPLPGAKIEVTAFAYLCASRIKSCVLLPQGGGEYTGELEFADPGKWEFRFVATRGAETYTSVVKQEIGGVAAAGD